MYIPSEKRDVWTIMRCDGACDPPRYSYKDNRTVEYFAILDSVYSELQGAGASWNAPMQLFLNGKYQNIGSSLMDAAYKYGTAKYAQISKAVERLQLQEYPGSLKDS